MMENSRFERADNHNISSTSKLKSRAMKNPSSMIGDFLSRLWQLFGEPLSVSYEGFDYIIKDTDSGMIFTAYSAGSGPAYGGKGDNKEQLIPIIEIFDKMLDAVIPADCEIRFENDFGTMVSGAKDGVPFDKMIES